MPSPPSPPGDPDSGAWRDGIRLARSAALGADRPTPAPRRPRLDAAVLSGRARRGHPLVPAPSRHHRDPTHEPDDLGTDDDRTRASAGRGARRGDPTARAASGHGAVVGRGPCRVAAGAHTDVASAASRPGRPALRAGCGSRRRARPGRAPSSLRPSRRPSPTCSSTGGCRAGLPTRLALVAAALALAARGATGARLAGAGAGLALVVAAALSPGWPGRLRVERPRPSRARWASV